MLRVQILLVILLSLLPSSSFAQERYGAVAGTWDACAQAAQPLREKVKAAQQEGSQTPERWLRYLKHRLAVALDKCAQSSDAPLSGILGITTLYEELGLDDRALAIALRAIAGLGGVAELHLVAGRLLFKKGIVHAAVAHLEEVVAQRPTDPDANQLLGSYFYGRGDYKQAMSFLRVAAKVRSEQFEANAALGDACLAVGDLDCAGEYLGRASQLKPSDALLAVKVGDLHRANGQFGPAMEEYERALVADPDRVDARLGLGRTAAKVGLTESAQAWFVEAADRAPKNVTAAIEASRALRAVGRPNPSRVLPVLGEGGGPVDAHVEHLLALLASGAVDKALEHIKATSRQFADDDRFAAVSGDALLAANSAGAALEQYRHARKLRPEAEPYLVREARALRLLGHDTEAAALLKPQLERGGEAVKTEFVSATLDLVRRNAKDTDMSKAAGMLEAVARVDPNDEGVRLSQAIVAATNGDEAKARTILETIPIAGPRRAAEAWVAYSSKRFADAARWAAEARGDLQDQAMVLLQGAALVKEGQSIKALEVLRSQKNATNDALVLEWRARALADAAYASIRAGRYGDSAELVRTESTTNTHEGFSRWFARVPLLAQAAEGKIDTSGPVFKFFRTAVKADKEQETIDKVLLALGDLENGLPQDSLKRLRSIRGSPEVDHLVDHARAELASQLFSKGREQEARKEGSAISKPETLSVEARLNLTVARYSNDQGRLAEALVPFADAKIPAALWDLAIMLGKTKKDGSAAIESLTKLMALSPPRLVRDKAEALLALKQRLY